MDRRILCALLAAFTAAGCAEAGTTTMPPEQLSAAVMMALESHSDDHGPRNFRTHATGGDEVPANNSRAQGQAIFQLNHDGTELSYRLIVANIQNVTQAHIHLAPVGVNGPVVVWLYPEGPPAQQIPGRSQGTIGEGVITSTSLVGPLLGEDVATLVEHILKGNVYVNIHTTQLPPGEIRGQIF